MTMRLYVLSRLVGRMIFNNYHEIAVLINVSLVCKILRINHSFPDLYHFWIYWGYLALVYNRCMPYHPNDILAVSRQ